MTEIEQLKSEIDSLKKSKSALRKRVRDWSKRMADSFVAMRAENERLRNLLNEISTAPIGRIEPPYTAPYHYDCPYCLDMREMAKEGKEKSNE